MNSLCARLPPRLEFPFGGREKIKKNRRATEKQSSITVDLLTVFIVFHFLQLLQALALRLVFPSRRPHPGSSAPHSRFIVFNCSALVRVANSTHEMRFSPLECRRHCCLHRNDTCEGKVVTGRLIHQPPTVSHHFINYS